MRVTGGVLIVLIAVAWLTIWSGALLDAYRRSEEDWIAAGESRTTWMLLIFVFQFFGLTAYLWRIQPKLDAARAART